ncbi:MAG: SpoIIIAH-like family protein, partial [Clostridia bacterium]|nr:SpoIIIAH-like family protein [Clostridia bacterium]
EETKAQALADISRIASEIEKEAAVEALVIAKGFEDCIAVLNGDSASIVVKCEGEVQAGQVAQISEIVYEQAGILPANVKIVCK